MFLIFTETPWLRTESFLWVPLWKAGRRREVGGWRGNMRFERDGPENRKNDRIYLCRVSFTFGKEDGLKDKGIGSFLCGCVPQVYFLLARETFPIYSHFRAYARFSEWGREEDYRVEKEFFSSSNFNVYLVSSIFGTEYSDSCLIISFILWICQHSTNIYLTPAMR